MKTFRFTSHKNYPDVYAQHKEERALSKKHGKKTEIVYMDPELLRSIKWRFYIMITPTPKSNDQLAQMLFVQNVEKAIELFGPDSLGMDYIKQRYAINIKEDYSKFFKKEDMQTILAKMQQNKQVAMNAAGVPAPSAGQGQNNAMPSRPKPGPQMKAAITQ
jgi:hypothetical protein